MLKAGVRLEADQNTVPRSVLQLSQLLLPMMLGIVLVSFVLSNNQSSMRVGAETVHMQEMLGRLVRWQTRFLTG